MLRFQVHIPTPVRIRHFSAFLSVPHPLGSPTYTRRKDRISYSQEEFIVDLTQVTSYTTPGSQVGCTMPQAVVSPQRSIARTPP